MKADYIQHNPMADTGIEGFKEFFKTRSGPLPVAATLPDLVAVEADGDYVMLAFVREYDDPLNKGEKYSTTLFDLLRFEMVSSPSTGTFISRLLHHRVPRA